jgi:ATP-dependent Clp protease ATP-binding subunit ClpC
MSQMILAEDAQGVLTAAARIADSWNHHWIGTEHLLLACAEAERDGRAVPRLAAAGLTFEVVDAGVRRSVPPKPERDVTWGGVVQTPRVQAIMGIAQGWSLAGTWPATARVDLLTLLFALLYEGEGVAAHVVVQAGLDLPGVVRSLGDDTRGSRDGRPS